MRLRIRDAGGARIVDLSGRLFLGVTSAHLELAVEAALAEKCDSIIFNLSRLEAIDSAGVGSIVVCHKRAVEKQARIKLVIAPGSTISPHVQTCLRLLFETFEHEADAVHSFRKQAGPG